MPIDLPALPLAAEVQPQLVSFGSDLTPALGGPVTRMRRFGSRYAVAVTLPSMGARCGAAWVAAILRSEAEGDTLRLVWPQADLEFDPPDANVNGDGQAGTSLNVSALTKDAPVGAFFSFTGADGRRYLHSLTEGAPAGTTQLQIAPMLRTAPVGGLEFNTPEIEGFVDGNSRSWKHQLRRWTSLSFTLTENA